LLFCLHAYLARSCPIFIDIGDIFDDFFEINRLANVTDKPNIYGLTWRSVGNVNKITMLYVQIEPKRLEVRGLTKDRYQPVYYRNIDKVHFSKQDRAFIANYVQSLDAYVMHRVIQQFTGPLIPIHDSWGIPMNRRDELYRIYIQALEELNKNGLNQLIDSFIDELPPNVKKMVGVPEIIAGLRVKQKRIQQTPLFKTMYESRYALHLG